MKTCYKTIEINYPFGELKKKQMEFFKNKEHEMNVRLENLKDLITILNEFKFDLKPQLIFNFFKIFKVLLLYEFKG